MPRNTDIAQLQKGDHTAPSNLGGLCGTFDAQGKWHANTITFDRAKPLVDTTKQCTCDPQFPHGEGPNTGKCTALTP